VNQQQPIQFTRAASDQIRETVARQRTGLRLDVQTTPPAAAHGELQTGSEDVFPVLIAKDGGADGTSSTRATWVYTVKNIDGTELATSVPVVKARPLGTIHYGNEIASPAYGQAFYNSAGTLLLWDAGEIPALTALAPITDFRVDVTSGEIQKKTHPILAPATADQTDWTKIEDTVPSKEVSCTAPGS
jgi:hypothetical protein